VVPTDEAYDFPLSEVDEEEVRDFDLSHDFGSLSTARGALPRQHDLNNCNCVVPGDCGKHEYEYDGDEREETGDVDEENYATPIVNVAFIPSFGEQEVMAPVHRQPAWANRAQAEILQAFSPPITAFGSPSYSGSLTAASLNEGLEDDASTTRAGASMTRPRSNLGLASMTAASSALFHPCAAVRPHNSFSDIEENSDAAACASVNKSPPRPPTRSRADLRAAWAQQTTDCAHLPSTVCPPLAATSVQPLPAATLTSSAVGPSVDRSPPRSKAQLRAAWAQQTTAATATATATTTGASGAESAGTLSQAASGNVPVLTPEREAVHGDAPDPDSGCAVCHKQIVIQWHCICDMVWFCSSDCQQQYHQGMDCVRDTQ